MTISQFLKIKLTAKSPEFKDICALKESGRSSELMDFVVMMHPNSIKETQAGRSKVITAKNTFMYVAYEGYILKTWHINNQTKRTLYKL